MKMTTFHSMIKFFTFMIECAVITILNMILPTIVLFYDFVEIYLLWLSYIPTVNK